MFDSEIVDSIERSEVVGRIADPLHEAAEAIFPDTDTARAVEDILHGKWLGHPVHPAITDVPVGSWTVALVLDALEARGRAEWKPGADAAVSIGLLGAAAAAITGLADWKYTRGRARRLGAAHAMAMGSATLLYATSLFLRRRGARGVARALSTLGYGVVSAGAFLGGELVLGEHIGTNHATRDPLPEDWVVAMPADRLEEGEMVRVEAGGVPVILVKRGKWISALAATCSHLGGPLDEGSLEGECVTCPWHGSTFNLDDGGVVNGPAAYPQPVFEARVMDGQIEVRRARN